VLEGEATASPRVETDRARFIGRGRDARAPIAVMDGRQLSGTVGTVLDPIFALRYRLRVRPPARACASRSGPLWPHRARAALALVDKQRDTNGFVRAATLAWTQAQIQLRHLDSDAAESSLFQRLAGHVLFADASHAPLIGQDSQWRRPGGTVGARHLRRHPDRAAAHRQPSRTLRSHARCCGRTNTGA
jgi:cyclic beta-1,2-glucan synthetase